MVDNWYSILDGDPRGLALYKRHYSRHVYKDGRKPRLFCGPGYKMVLLNQDATALFVWRKFIDASGQRGINCAIFRNESDKLSSDLILEAEQLAWQKWPGERLYTYVNGKRVISTNPGYCFLMAGWRKCGMTKGGLVILEKCALPQPPEGEK